MLNNFNDELKCHLNRILLINHDEEKKTFENLPNNFEKDNYYSQFYIIIVCTQNSLSGTKKHFQNYFKRYIKQQGFELLSKVDATKQSSRRNTTLKKNYNVRTRVYYRKDMVHLLFDNKKFLNSYNRTKWITTRKNKTNIRTTNSINKIKLIDNDFNKYPFIMESYNIFRDTYDDKGYGLICVNLNFYLSDKKILSLLVINENKKTNNMSGGADPVQPLINNNNKLYKSKFDIENNKIIKTTCTINGIETNNSNNTLTQFNNNRNEITIKNENIPKNINKQLLNNFSKKRLLLKIPYLNKIIQIINKDKTIFNSYATILKENGIILNKCDEFSTLKYDIIPNIKQTQNNNNKNKKNAIVIDSFLQNEYDKTAFFLAI